MNKKIYTDKKRINTDNKQLIYADLTYKVRGAIFTVFNELGFGHKEQVYQKALEKEFEQQKIPFKKEVDLKVKYKGNSVGNYRPDFLVEGKLIIEIKSVEFMPKSYDQQVVYYLKTTDIKLGLLVNFGRLKLQIKRFIWTGNPRKSNYQRKSVTNPRKSIYAK